MLKVPVGVPLHDVAKALREQGDFWVAGKYVIREMFAAPQEAANPPKIQTWTLALLPIYENHYQSPSLLLLYGGEDSQIVVAIDFPYTDDTFMVDKCYEDESPCIHLQLHEHRGGPCDRHGCKPAHQRSFPDDDVWLVLPDQPASEGVLSGCSAHD